MLNRRSLASSLSILPLTVGSALAATSLVSFGPSTSFTSAGNQALRDSALTSWTSGTTPTVGFSDSAALSPSSNWSGTNSVFYGGFSSVVSGTAGQSRFATVIDNATSDRIRIGITAGTGNSITSFAGVVYWDKSNFLNGGSSASISLDNSSSILINVAAATNLRARWVIRNGSQFYVSNGTTNFTSSSSGSFSLSNATLMATSWDQYNPATSLTWTSGTGTVSSTALTDITGVGVYFVSTNSTAGQNFNLTFDSFAFSGVLGSQIPEPSSFAVLSGLGILGFAASRRRR